MLLPLAGLGLGVLLGLLLKVNVSFELARYSAVAIVAALDSVLGAVRAELDGVYDNRIFVSGFITNTVVAVLLTYLGDRLGLDLYLVALFTFGGYFFGHLAFVKKNFSLVIFAIIFISLLPMAYEYLKHRGGKKSGPAA